MSISESILTLFTAGLMSIAVAENSVTVDRTPPLTGSVYDGSIISLDATYQSSTEMLCVNWEGVVDPESGVVEIDWTISKYMQHN